MKNEVKSVQIVAIDKIKINTKNRNYHPDDQIERLKKIIALTGFRNPLVVSNQSGKLVTGHGRLLAAKALGFTELPVIYQDFASPEDEYAHGVADNAIAGWSELDFSGINTDLEALGPDFDVDCLGLKNFLIEPADKFLNTDLWEGEFEKAEQKFKAVILVESKDLLAEVLKVLGIVNHKKFQNGDYISAHWPDVEK